MYPLYRATRLLRELTPASSLMIHRYHAVRCGAVVLRRMRKWAELYVSGHDAARAKIIVRIFGDHLTFSNDLFQE